MPLDAEQITIVALLLAILAGGMRGVWVFGWAFTAMVKDRDFWRDVALKSMGTTDKALTKVDGG